MRSFLRRYALALLAVIALAIPVAVYSAGTGQISLSGAISGAAGGAKTIGPFTINLNAPLEAESSINLTSSFTALTVPSGATGLFVIPPSANTQTITLKGVTGDTGILLNKTQANVIVLDSGVTNIGLTGGGAINGVQVVWF